MATQIPGVIGLTGNIGAGKSTVAALLRMLGYREVNFGDALRREVAEVLSHPNLTSAPETIDNGALPDSIQELLRSSILLPSDVFKKPTLPLMRRLLQLWGTEYRRAQDENYWVKQLEPTISRPGLWVIGDVRFQNEADLVHAKNGLVLRIERPGETLSSPHASEKQDFKVDETIWNNGLVGELADCVLSTLGLTQLKEPL